MIVGHVSEVEDRSQVTLVRHGIPRLFRSE